METILKNGARDFWTRRRQAARAKAVDVHDEGERVRESLLAPGQTLPLVITPILKDLDLNAWIAKNRAELREKVIKHGAILFRGFNVRSPLDFERFNDAFGIELMKYMEGATPRKNITARVATSTLFPPDQTIFPHNELCYVNTWPRHIMFCCLEAPAVGGATPIVDVRAVHRRLHPEATDRFKGRGWMLVRNFGDGFGPDWRTSFHVERKEELEAYCRRAGVAFEWLDGDRLRTRQIRPAVADHPVTGERLWFNHIAFWHLSSLDPKLREFMLDDFGVEGLPFASYYGDGTPIEDEVVATMRRAYDAEKIIFPWQAGDILILDNMLTAHGREPFQGDRLILAAMGDPFSQRFLNHNDPEAITC